MKLAAAEALADVVGGRAGRRTTSSRASSTRWSPRPSPRRSPRRRARTGWPAPLGRSADTALGRLAAMLAVTADRIDADDPLTGLGVGERPDPVPPDGWTTVRVRAAALNHHDLWTLKGVGHLAGPAADRARLRRCGHRRGRARGHRARGDRRPGCGRRRRDARPPALAAVRGARRDAGRAGRGAAAQPRPEAGRAVVGGGGLPADRVADGVPDAVRPRRAEGRATRCWCRVPAAGVATAAIVLARAGGAAGVRHQPGRGQAGAGAGDRGARRARSRARGCPSGSTR